MSGSSAPSGSPGNGGGGSRKRPRDEGEAAATAEGADEDDDELIHVDDLFDDQDALYGASSDAECTFGRGYLPRQPVYACRTCQTDGPAAICYGCAKRCHEGHDLLELYSKRGLCCDCGNAKFADAVDPATGEKFTCQLCEFKTLNRDNRYNQNFQGLYCVCARPYPDPDGPLPDEEMLQCAVCEDWFHGCHLVLPAWCRGLSSEVNEELVCQLCSGRLPYLRRYAMTAPPPPGASTSESPDTSAKPSDTPAGSSDIPHGPSDTPAGSSDIPHRPSDTPAKPRESVNSGGGQSDVPCVLAGDLGPLSPTPTPPMALLMPAGWRRRLCRCPTCLAVYAADEVAFLTEPADSLAEFELTNRRVAEEQSRPENVLRSLASAGVPHVSVQLVASAMGDFRRGLTHALARVLAEKNCAEGQPAVITRQDADRILAMMAPVLAKRARFQPPDNCGGD